MYLNGYCISPGGFSHRRRGWPWLDDKLYELVLFKPNPAFNLKYMLHVINPDTKVLAATKEHLTTKTAILLLKILD